MQKSSTQARLAAKLGISQQRVAVLAAKGMPTDSVVAARKWRAEHLDPRKAADASPKQRAAASADQAALLAARRQREETEARLSALRLAEHEGKLLEVEGARHAFNSAVAIFAEELNSLPQRLAPVLVGLDARAIGVRLQTELDELRTRVVIRVRARRKEVVTADVAEALAGN